MVLKISTGLQDAATKAFDAEYQVERPKRQTAIPDAD